MIRALFASLLLLLTPVAASAQTLLFSPNSLPLSGSCGTVTANAPCLDLTQTWNNAGITFYGFRLNVTDTASASGSLLMDLQVAGSSKFKVDKTGLVTAASSLTTFGAVRSLNDTGQVTWGVSNDVVLTRDAANTLALRNGASAQAFRVYNTYTDASNYEYFGIDWASSPGNVLLGMVKAGTGSFRTIIMTAGGNLLLRGGAGNKASLGVVGASDLISADNKDHMSVVGSSPVLTLCGTSPTIVGSDTAGEVTTGTATPTACTITFANTYTAQPYCTVEDRTALANLTSYTVSTSAIVLTTAAASSQKIVYHCLGA